MENEIGTKKSCYCGDPYCNHKSNDATGISYLNPAPWSETRKEIAGLATISVLLTGLFLASLMLLN